MPRPLEENGKGYWFVDREDMEEEIAENNFLEHGEHNGNLYGTHLDSIRSVIKEGLSLDLSANLRSFHELFPPSGKMCILDCSPSALKLLHNSPEFMPFVIFVAAPGMDQLKQLYAERRAAGGSQKNLAVSQ
jgi:MAGUK p55 subfamily member 2/6